MMLSFRTKLARSSPAFVHRGTMILEYTRELTSIYMYISNEPVKSSRVR